MSFKLEELRRRVRERALMEESGQSAPPLAMELEGGNTGTMAGSGSYATGSAAGLKPMAEAVAKIFDQTKSFKPRFDELNDAIDQIERLGEATARTFAPLKAFQSHLVYLIASLDSIRQFQTNLEQLVRTFSPAQALYDELATLTDSFQLELNNFVQSLQPAREFRDRILVLARSLDQANEMLDELQELQASFPARSGGPSQGQGEDLIGSILDRDNV